MLRYFRVESSIIENGEIRKARAIALQYTEPPEKKGLLKKNTLFHFCLNQNLIE